jgi:hypothetical protein
MPTNVLPSQAGEIFLVWGLVIGQGAACPSHPFSELTPLPSHNRPGHAIPLLQHNRPMRRPCDHRRRVGVSQQGQELRWTNTGGDHKHQRKLLHHQSCVWLRMLRTRRDHHLVTPHSLQEDHQSISEMAPRHSNPITIPTPHLPDPRNTLTIIRRLEISKNTGSQPGSDRHHALLASLQRTRWHPENTSLVKYLDLVRFNPHTVVLLWIEI